RRIAMIDNHATRILDTSAEIRKYISQNGDISEEDLMKAAKVNKNTLYTILYTMAKDPNICKDGEYLVLTENGKLTYKEIEKFLSEKKTKNRGPRPPERLLYLYHHLHNALPYEGLSMKELKHLYSDLMERSGMPGKNDSTLKKMIERDLEELEQIGIIILRPSQGYKKYCLKEVYLPKLRPESAAAVYVSMMLYKNTLLQDATSRAKEQLGKHLIMEKTISPEILSDRIYVVGDTLAHPEQFGDRLNRLIQAILQTCRIKIDYEKINGEVSARKLEPLGLVSKRNVWYLIAKDVKKDEIRTFRVDQISNVILRDLVKFQYPQTFQSENISAIAGEFSTMMMFKP
ncbi:MAG: WYL domain-containing protein, partial [Syntrophomonas sp.]